MNTDIGWRDEQVFPPTSPNKNLLTKRPHLITKAESAAVIHEAVIELPTLEC